MTMTSLRAIPELSIDTQTLERRLIATVVDDIVAYEELTALIGRDVRYEASHVLRSARVRLQRDHGMVFETVRGIGLKLLNGEAVTNSVGEAARARIRAITDRTIKKLVTVDFATLSNELKVKWNFHMGAFGCLRHMTSPAVARRLEAAMPATQHDALPTAKYLDAWKQAL